MDLIWIYILSYALFLVATGYSLPFIKQRSIARTFGWIIAIATVVVSTFVTTNESALVRMLVIVYLQLLSMKVLVAIESYSGENKLTIFQWLAFSLGWFGMRPVLFEKLPSASKEYRTLLVKGITRIIVGFILLYLSSLFTRSTYTNQFFLPELLMLAGVSFILHFGILNLSTASWRAVGVDVSELFRSPYKSKSLKEFWGKRWNLAFSEMTALIAYRPLRDKVGVEWAVVLSFLLSGLLHEIAISFPVNAGYGLPMIYFIIHAIAMQLESKVKFVQKITLHRVWSHVWVMGLLVLPMPLLFHRAFVENVIVPVRELVIGMISM